MSNESNGATRRDFLKIATTAAPAAAVALATGEQADASTPDLASQKMQDTAHVRAYYDSARF
jgi:hypothetical protein